MKVQGPALVLGNDVNTDVMLPGRYLFDWETLGEHVLEGLGADYPARARGKKVVVAGKNFGCGSSREQAVMAFKQAGVECIVARSFARIFFRNCVNLGLPPLTADVDVPDGAVLEVDLGTGTIAELSTGRSWQAKPLPPNVLAIIKDGGLIPHLKGKLSREKGQK
jgi:3-isopropylmalate dehydratase small subunit